MHACRASSELLSAMTHTESLDVVSYRFDQRHRLRSGRLGVAGPILLTASQRFCFWRGTSRRRLRSATGQDHSTSSRLCDSPHVARARPLRAGNMARTAGVETHHDFTRSSACKTSSSVSADCRNASRPCAYLTESFGFYQCPPGSNQPLATTALGDNEGSYRYTSRRQRGATRGAVHPKHGIYRADPRSASLGVRCANAQQIAAGNRTHNCQPLNRRRSVPERERAITTESCV